MVKAIVNAAAATSARFLKADMVLSSSSLTLD
jgi:hypothetical protein